MSGNVAKEPFCWRDFDGKPVAADLQMPRYGLMLTACAEAGIIGREAHDLAARMCRNEEKAHRVFADAFLALLGSQFDLARKVQEEKDRQR